VQRGFGVAAGKEMVAIGITGSGAIAARGEQVKLKDREAKLALEQGGVEIIGKTIVREMPGKGMHWNTGKQGKQ
jgi:hypothetical protein